MLLLLLLLLAAAVVLCYLGQRKTKRARYTLMLKCLHNNHACAQGVPRALGNSTAAVYPNCAIQVTLAIDMLHHRANYSGHVYLSPYRPCKDTGLDCLLQLLGGQ